MESNFGSTGRVAMWRTTNDESAPHVGDSVGQVKVRLGQSGSRSLTLMR